MDITKELIQNFFNKQCTPEEAAEVSSYLNNNPEVLDEYLSKNEWDEDKIITVKPDAFWNELWVDIKLEKQQRKPLTWFKKITVAATITGILAATGWLFIHQQKPQTNINVVAAFVHKTIKNTGNSIKHVTLNDGSRVSLSPNSTVEFDEPFQNNRRNINLTGEAVFKVAKDKTRPFTVVSGAIATTALGTKFRVISYDDNRYIKVLLYEGRIVVKSTDPANKKLAGGMHLIPGNELTYNKTQMQVDISSVTSISTVKVPGKNKTAWLAFRKEALPDVFDKLAAKYQTHINYSNNDLTQLYFIGSFDKTDSLENILQTISKLNGLKVIKNSDGGYIITK